MTFSRLSRFAGVAALVLAASCTDSSDQAVAPHGPISFSVYSGNNQEGEVGQELAQPIQVLATDANEQPIPDQVVNFVVTAGGGSVFAGTAITDANGIAAEVWRLGTVAGSTQTVEVRAVAPDGTKQVFGVFTATAKAGPPDTIEIVAGDSQSAPVGAALPVAPAVRLADQYGNPVVGHSVTFAATAGGGSVTGSPALSNDEGIATVGSWTLGGTPGANTLTATAQGLPGSPVVFTATAQPLVVPHLAITTQPAATAQSGLAFSPQPVLQLLDDQDQPLAQAGVAVTASISSGGGSLGGTLTVLTDANGTATFTDLVLTGLVGDRTLAFDAPNVTGVTSGTIALGPGLPALVVVGDGEGQSVNAGQPVPVAPSVVVTDLSGNPVPGAMVTFEVTAGGGSLTGANATTDAAGVAQVGSWTLGPASGANTLSATVDGSGITGNPVVFTATALGNFWTQLASALSGHRFPAFGVLDGRLYVAGGKDQGLTIRNRVEFYDPATDSWTIRAGMKTARVGPAGGVINGIFYVAGGQSPGTTALNTVEAYDPNTNSWSYRAPMPVARNFAAAAVLDGLLYVVGGGTGSGQLASMYAYDPATDTWSARAPMPAVRNDMVAVALNGLLYVIGGQQGNNNDGALQIYDPATDSWSMGATMLTPRYHVMAEVHNGLIYVAGGLESGAVQSDKLEVYDPATDTWTALAPMLIPRTGGAVGNINGVLYFAGGGNNGGVFDEAQSYVP